MKFNYNAFEFSDLGEVFITQAREMEGPADQPQRARVTLRVRVEVFERSYDQNRELLDRCREALRLPNAGLQWRNDAAGVDYVNQTAVLVSDDLPEEWGEYHQVLNLVFSYYEQTPGGASNNLPLTFTKTGGEPVKFDVVNRWVHGASVDRFSRLRKHRRETHATIAVEGQWFGDTTQSLDARRSALALQAKAFNDGMNGADGLMVFGQDGAVFSGKVRIEQWECEVDQAVNAISFRFTAGYTLVPDESDYSTAEFNVDEQDDYSGVLAFAISGKIQSATLVAAKTKLDALLAAVTAQRGYDKAQPLRKQTSDTNVDGVDGQTFVELAFSANWRQWKPTNQKATFQRTGGAKAVPFGDVRSWHFDYAAQRISEMRSERRHATGKVDAAGTWTVDPTMPLAERRAALLAMQRAMETEVNSADGTLKYGDWSQVVRVDDLQADINQAETGIDWSLSASWSLFPNEAGYATADFAVDARQEVESGDEVMLFSGRIEAPNGALARAKLDSLRTAVLKMYGWSVTQRLDADTTLNAIDANGDRTKGVAEGLEGAGDFSTINLNFSERYRRRQTGALVSSTMSRLDREDIPSQLLVTTFSGSVSATGPTADAAYATALARAQALGANRQAGIDTSTVFRSSVIAQETRQTRADNALEFVRLNYSYEYQSKLTAGRAFIELTTSVAQDTFGVDQETCSGVVMARDLATAQGIYEAQIKSLYASRLVQNEQTGSSVQKTQVGAAYAGQHMRFEFNLTAYSPKASGRTAWKYSIEVEQDRLTLDMRTVVSGSVYAVNRPAADTALDLLFQFLKLTNSARTRRLEERERLADGASILDVMLKLDFDEEFRGRVTGSSGVIEMSLTENVKFSGIRWSVQDIPFVDGIPARGGGISIPQPTGYEPGSRTVSGSVTAATLATATAWAKKQRALLTGDKRGKSYVQPEQLETGYEFVPRIEGIPQGDNSNVKIYRVNFTFAEILPYYPAT